MKASRSFETQNDAIQFANFIVAIGYEGVSHEWIEYLGIWRVWFTIKE